MSLASFPPGFPSCPILIPFCHRLAVTPCFVAFSRTTALLSFTFLHSHALNPTAPLSFLCSTCRRRFGLPAPTTPLIRKHSTLACPFASLVSTLPVPLHSFRVYPASVTPMISLHCPLASPYGWPASLTFHSHFAPFLLSTFGVVLQIGLARSLTKLDDLYNIQSCLACLSSLQAHARLNSFASHSHPLLHS